MKGIVFSLIEDNPFAKCFPIFAAFAKDEDLDWLWSVWSQIVAPSFYYNRTQKKVMKPNVRQKKSRRKCRSQVFKGRSFTGENTVQLEFFIDNIIGKIRNIYFTVLCEFNPLFAA